ncbi:MAG TPA: Uma2 family endonuclease [Bryobacteraceae bacterium]|jgi:Uma2 family endonuclease|nr:Uma2 family endonuclease [Bryobacteraceae bacterium]
MNLVLEDVEDIAPIVLHPPAMDDDEFYDFCQRFDKGLRVERMADGCVVIMAPAGFESSFRNSNLTAQLAVWAERDGRGAAFDSNTEFFLPDGSAFGPDAAWVVWERIRKLTPKQKRKFARLCPDFIIELMSPSDRMAQAQRKMQLWIDNGVLLGWLIDADRRTVTIYRPSAEPEVLENPDQIAGEGPVAGFVLDLKNIWAGL